MRCANRNDRTTAGYAQLGYDLGNATGIQGLGVSAGGRYTQDKLTLDILPSSRFYDFPGLPNEVGDTFDKVSWQFGVQEQLDPNLLLYVTTRRSFRSGGFNPFTPQSPGTAAQGGNEFLPEVATDVEVGTKFQGLIGSLPTRFDFDVYTGTIDDVQRSIYIPTPSGIASLTVTYGPFADAPKFAGSLFAQTSSQLPFATLTVRGEIRVLRPVLRPVRDTGLPAPKTADRVRQLPPGGRCPTSRVR